MAISRAATLSVLVAVALFYISPLPPWIVFLISGIGVTLIYRAIKGCFNFVNPMALTGTGAVVLVYYFYPSLVLMLVAGMVVSVVVGLLVP